MYPGDYKGTLKNTAYEAGTRIIEFLAAAGWKLNYNRLLSGVYQVKGYAEKIEYLAKGRFRNLLRETVACTEYPGWNMAYYGPLDIRAKNINKMFYINDRQKINRIRDENGGNEMVRWMQYSDETGEKIPTETLRWLLRCGLGPENIRYHAGKYLSTTQLMNYIRRQQKEQYPGFTEEAVLEQYNDYLSMCKACKKNMKDELTYRPRELKRRHDEIVTNKQQMDGYHNGFIGSIYDAMYPITMPYAPADKPDKIVCDELLTDPKNGDYDTKAIIYIEKPDGKKVKINRYFKESEESFKEISWLEYQIRRYKDWRRRKWLGNDEERHS